MMKRGNFIVRISPRWRRIFKCLSSIKRTFFVVAGISAPLLSIPSQAQPYPALTRVISFDNLLDSKTLKMVQWTNPNGVREKLVITEMAIPVDQRMIALTRDFVLSNYGLQSTWLKPRVIVFHALGGGGLKNSLEISSFLHDQMPDSWGNLSKAGKLPNGAHFIIEKNGNVICLTPPLSADESRISYDRNNHQWRIKRHQDGNPVALGIENVTDPGKLTVLTPEQIESNAKLARWLIWMENGKIDYMMSHHQFNDDADYDLFLTAFKLKHLQKQYRTRGRTDIGDSNLRRIINKINQYGYTPHSFFELK